MMKNIKNIINKIFKRQDCSENHYTYVVLGLKLNILKPKILAERKRSKIKYLSYSNPSNIPEAEGNLRTMQIAESKILKIFDSICKEYELNYWIDFGTLLGAIRHKGFIPWDDDIDISMLRNDYEKLIKLFYNGFPNNLPLKLYFENNKRNKCFLKLEYIHSKNITIDIFPYDLYYKQLSPQEKTILSKKINHIIIKNKLRYFKNTELIRKHFAEITNKKILNNIPVDRKTNPDIFMAIDFPHKWKNKVYAFNDIFPLRTVEFENYAFPAPNKPSKILTSIYGNYMKLPKDLYPRHTAYMNLSETEIKILNEINE